ncbi:MAG: hypothetical protein EAZ89_10355 [Bacteroidetes bacterium]|nr:MAG: hypothetical protein EAZ89_10355 [Bacteroidota bacterium]
MRIFSLLLLALLLSAWYYPKAPASLSVGILYQSADGGANWQDISQELPGNLQVSCVSALGAEIFVGTGNGYVFHSLLRGPWKQEYVGGAIPEQQAGMISGVFSGATGTYACVAQGGLYRQIPGTHLWNALFKNLKDKVVHAVIENADRHLLIACPSGIYSSRDGGTTWKQTYALGWVRSLASSGGALVAGSAQGLLRSTDGGEHWTCVLADEQASFKVSAFDGIFAAVREAGPWRTATDATIKRAFVSADGGKTWQRIDTGLKPGQYMLDLEQAGNYLFCSHKAGISRSADKGKTWELVRSAEGLGENVRFELVTSGKLVFAWKLMPGC